MPPELEFSPLKSMKRTIFLIALAAPFSLAAQNVNSLGGLKTISEEQLVNAQEELATLEEQIETESIPLAKRLNELENQAISLRRELTEARLSRELEESSLLKLRETVDSLVDNNSYIANLLRDYITRFQTQIHVSEQSFYSEAASLALAAVEDEDMSEGRKFELELDVMEAALDRVGNIIGGYTYESTALVGDQLDQASGRFALLGPVAFFSSDDGQYHGLALEQENQTEPVIFGRFPFPVAEGISSLTSTGSGSAPFDGTLGEAIKFIIEDYDIAEELFERGGFVIYFILGLAGVAALLALFKLFEIITVKKARQKDLDAILGHLREGNQEQALQYAQGVGGPVGRLLVAAVEHSNDDKEIIEEVCYEVIINTQPKLERMLPFISVTAATAPLLGLLGTVTGMIRTFKLITVVGTGDARSLSSGISEALITTKWGLIVAIPSLITHAILSRMAKGVVGSMEQTAVGFINGIDEIRQNKAA